MSPSEERLYLVYVTKDRGYETKRVTTSLSASGMTMFELIDEFAAMLRAMGYPLEFGSTLQVVKENEVVADAFTEGCAACSPVDEDEEGADDGIGDEVELEEVPK